MVRKLLIVFGTGRQAQKLLFRAICNLKGDAQACNLSDDVLVCCKVFQQTKAKLLFEALNFLFQRLAQLCIQTAFKG